VADVGKNTRRLAITQAWWELDGTDFRLIEELAFLQGTRPYCFPSREYLAAKLKVSIGTISRHTHKLSHLGLLKIQPRRYRRVDGTWRTRSNLYALLTFIGSKLRQLLALLTGVRPSARRPKQKKEKEPFSLSFVKNQTLKSRLESFSKLGTMRIQV